MKVCPVEVLDSILHEAYLAPRRCAHKAPQQTARRRRFAERLVRIGLRGEAMERRLP